MIIINFLPTTIAGPSLRGNETGSATKSSSGYQEQAKRHKEETEGLREETQTTTEIIKSEKISFESQSRRAHALCMYVP